MLLMILFQLIDLIFLQTTSKQVIDVPTLALIISFITMTIFAITLGITWRATKANTKATNAQLLRNFHEDLTGRLNKNAVLRTTEDCERYANDFLNTLDEIAYLSLDDKIPTDIAEYLKRFFAYGWRIIDWYNEMIGEDFREIAKKNWPNYFEFCERNKIKTNPDDKLPKIMLDYNKLRDKEQNST